MKVKTRIVEVLVLMCLWSLSSFAQEAPAKRAFVSGDYNAAVGFYKTAIATIEEGKSVSDLNASLKLAQRCASLLSKADEQYEKTMFEEARANYQALLNLNPSDRHAERRLSSCDAEIASAAQIKRDNEAWGKARSIFIDKMDVEAVQLYLSDFPNAEHKNEAQDCLDEYELWLNAKAENKEAAYRHYIEESKMHLYKEEALKLIFKIKDRDNWHSALIANTEIAFENYIREAGNEGKYLKQAQANLNLFDAMDEFRKGYYQSAYKLFNDAKKYCTFNDEHEDAFNKCREEIAYAKLTQYDIKGCKDFLSTYPYSSHVVEVKELLSKAYCSIGNFDDARGYATTKEMMSYINSSEKEWKKNAKAASRSHKSSNVNHTKSVAHSNRPIQKGSRKQNREYKFAEILSLNVGYDCFWGTEMSSINSFPIGVKIGHVNQFFNVILGGQLSWINGKEVDMNETSYANIAYTQYAASLQLRFNVVRWSDNNSFYLAPGAVMNFNKKARYAGYEYFENNYAHSKDRVDFDMEQIMNPLNYAGRISVGLDLGGYIDLSVYVNYDVTSPYNKAVIDKMVSLNLPDGKTVEENFYTMDSIRKQVDNKFYVGISAKIQLFAN